MPCPGTSSVDSFSLVASLDVGIGLYKKAIIDTQKGH